jgi:hypothetical protein
MKLKIKKIIYFTKFVGIDIIMVLLLEISIVEFIGIMMKRLLALQI